MFMNMDSEKIHSSVSRSIHLLNTFFHVKETRRLHGCSTNGFYNRAFQKNSPLFKLWSLVSSYFQNEWFLHSNFYVYHRNFMLFF